MSKKHLVNEPRPNTNTQNQPNTTSESLNKSSREGSVNYPLPATPSVTSQFGPSAPIVTGAPAVQPATTPTTTQGTSGGESGS